jgi:hypothetical protein
MWKPRITKRGLVEAWGLLALVAFARNPNGWAEAIHDLREGLSSGGSAAVGAVIGFALACLLWILAIIGLVWLVEDAWAKPKKSP